ncbi:MAG: hypothetical protein ACPG8A_00800 [Psychrobium sp.]
MNQQQITIEEVHGGFDLILRYQNQQAILFIQDKAQANFIGEQIINIAKEQKIDINSAAAIFNQGTGMFAG